MDVDQIKQAIADSKDKLEEAFQKSSYKDNPAVREGWYAWEWTKQQLLAKGMDEESAQALISVGLVKQRRLGTYDAIRELLFGDQVTLIVG